MWVDERDGKYRFFERYRDPMTGKQKTVSCTLDRNTTQSRKKAQAILNEKIAQAQNVTGSPSLQLTFSELVERCLVLKERTVKHSSFESIKTAWHSLVRIIGPDTLVDNLTAGYVNQKLLDQNEKPSTTNTRIDFFKGLIRFGYNNDIVRDIQFLDRIKPLKDTSHRAKIQDKYLEHDEIGILLGAIKKEQWKLVTEFMLLSGLRFGEVAALNKEDVDLDERVIHVTKTFTSTVKEVSTPKSLSSARDVYIQPELYTLCRKILSWTMKQELQNGNRSDLFFHRNNGDKICITSYNRYIDDVSRKVLGRKISSHVLRHTHASMLMEQGVDIDTISRRLGHEDSAITREIYLHVTEKLKENDRKKIEGVRIL